MNTRTDIVKGNRLALPPDEPFSTDEWDDVVYMTSMFISSVQKKGTIFVCSMYALETSIEVIKQCASIVHR